MIGDYTGQVKINYLGVAYKTNVLSDGIITSKGPKDANSMTIKVINGVFDQSSTTLPFSSSLLNMITFDYYNTNTKQGLVVTHIEFN